jgi:pimeloyl-ACP methyl ester carboxylesterase
MTLFAHRHGAGPPLVLLPWFGHDGGVLAAACEPVLDGLPYQRVYLDLPGTGRSAPVEPRSDAVAAAVGETIDDLGAPAGVPVVGCSYGGYLAAAVARRTPYRIHELMLACSGIRIRPGDRDLRGVAPPVTEPGWLDGVPDRHREHLSRAVGRQTGAVADRIAAALAAGPPPDEGYLAELRGPGYPVTDEAALAELAVPVTVLAGRRDRIAGFRDQFEFAARGPAGGDYVLLDECGHYLPFEQPERFADLVRVWLGRAGAV